MHFDDGCKHCEETYCNYNLESIKVVSDAITQLLPTNVVLMVQKPSILPCIHIKNRDIKADTVFVKTGHKWKIAGVLFETRCW
jgi:hypothetical protein